MPLLFGNHAYYHRVNLDGFFNYTSLKKQATPIMLYSYVFWDGSIELCDTTTLEPQQIGNSTLRQFQLPYFESQLVNAVQVAVTL